MTIQEKYPENIPWDLTSIDNSNYKSIQWMLSKADIVYTFTRSRIDNNYVYIQKMMVKERHIKNMKLDLLTKDCLTRDIH